MKASEESPTTGSTSGEPLAPGLRCRSTRAIVHPGGMLRRAAEGTLLSVRENLGRMLFTVGFDTGHKLILFVHEIEAMSA